MNTSCNDVKTLLASYLDGELSPDQGGPVRTHLLACGACRETMQEGKVIRRWFHDARERFEIPQGFAARTARRAFAGDPGLLQPAPVESRPLLSFVLGLAALAAGLLFVFSLFLQRESLPQDDRLDAGERFWDPTVQEGSTPLSVEREVDPEETDDVEDELR